MYKYPDWRYRDAMNYIADDPHRILQDRLTRRLAAHIKLVQGKTVRPSRLVRRDLLWVDQAYQIKCDVGPGSARWLIEALALGGMPVDAVSESVGVEREVVETYLDCFFDVRDNSIKERYIKSMGRYTCSYDHSMLAPVGYKYIVTHFGLEVFQKYIFQRHLLSQGELKMIREDGRNSRSIRSWSRSWESMNPEAVMGRSDVEELSVLVKEDLAEKDMNRKDENAKRLTNTDKGEDTLKEVWKYIRIGMVSAPVPGLGAREERLITN